MSILLSKVSLLDKDVPQAQNRLETFSFHSFSKFMIEFSDRSYMIYLIHGSLILFLVKPIFTILIESQLSSLIMIILSPIYCLIVFLLAKSVSSIIDSLIFRLFKNNYQWKINRKAQYI